jgi:hypothetical protein
MVVARYVATPEEAQPIADMVVEALVRDGWNCEIEKPLSVDAPRTTVVLANRRGEPTCLIEAQARPSYGPSLSGFASWLRAERAHARFSLATTVRGKVSGAVQIALKRDGVGLIVVGSGEFTVMVPAICPAYVVHVDPQVSLGRHGTTVRRLIDDFNVGNRIGALRDMCEFVEAETGKVTRKANRKGVIAKPASEVALYNWSTEIDVLKSVGVIDAALKADLHSFRNARNLVDHPARSASQTLARRSQLGERMVMGARLAGELLRASRRL